MSRMLDIRFGSEVEECIQSAHALEKRDSGLNRGELEQLRDKITHRLTRLETILEEVEDEINFLRELHTRLVDAVKVVQNFEANDERRSYERYRKMEFERQYEMQKEMEADYRDEPQ